MEKNPGCVISFPSWSWQG